MPARYISYNLTPEVRVSKAESGTTLEWYPAVFDSLSEDLGGFREKINRRAFTKTVQESDVRALLNHNPDLVLGRNKAGTLKLHVDHAGLRATVDLPDTQLGRDLAVSVERGDITAGSFGFRPVGETSDWWRKDETGAWVRELKEVQLFDVSPVTFPAYPGTDGSAAMRAIDGFFEVDDLVHPLIALRAGVPLAAQERDRLQGVIASLQRSIEPPEAHPTPDRRLRYFDMTLSMLSRGGR